MRQLQSSDERVPLEASNRASQKKWPTAKGHISTIRVVHKEGERKLEEDFEIVSYRTTDELQPTQKGDSLRHFFLMSGCNDVAVYFSGQAPSGS